MKPLATWDDQNSQHPDLIWWSQLDNKFLCEAMKICDVKFFICRTDLTHDDKLPVDLQSKQSAITHFLPKEIFSRSCILSLLPCQSTYPEIKFLFIEMLVKRIPN